LTGENVPLLFLLDFFYFFYDLDLFLFVLSFFPFFVFLFVSFLFFVSFFVSFLFLVVVVVLFFYWIFNPDFYRLFIFFVFVLFVLFLGSTFLRIEFLLARVWLSIRQTNANLLELLVYRLALSAE